MMVRFCHQTFEFRDVLAPSGLAKAEQRKAGPNSKTSRIILS